jgi:hypothetical protein
MQGTPKQFCAANVNASRLSRCYHDTSRLGSDANGIYIASLMFDLETFNFHSTNILALPKEQLLAG